ncbi:hypothetical protein [Thalassoroseus pseudoceratinae]|uniref:hypothetical protein n=1 Tax=Thalassoroseus pseudoceratinae TaxID=2713176 RepID=UPI00142196C7|nr:hypothetical protein [Thalassoroseus pseudoceratinae]
MRRRRLVVLKLACGLLLLANVGCATPRYRWPQGFSGTYHRALFGDPHPPMPDEIDDMEKDTAEEHAAGVFYPEKLTIKPPTQSPTRYAIVPPTAIRR